MRGPYSDYAAPPVYVYSQPAPQGIRFSRTELYQLAVAILALSAAFTVVTLNPFYGGTANLAYFPSDVAGIGFFFLAALVSVGSGVGLHEIMHKITAERYGYWAEFRYSLRGLAMAFMFAFLGFIFGAPGATYISGPVNREQNGRISAAGPVTNIVLGAGFFGLVLLLYPMAFTAAAAAYAVLLFEYAASVNLILAGFNMIPIMPLDGAKVWHWNKGIWVGILAVVALILGTGAYLGYLFL